MKLNKNTLAAAVLALAACNFACPPIHAETVRNLEAVDGNGFSTWSAAFPFTITGVILNDPAEMLDATPNFIPWNGGAGAFQMGGQWQIFVQAVSGGDRGGVECWMGQNYGNLPFNPHDGSASYDNAAWAAEVDRVSRDALSGHVFRKGDLVTVTANGSLFYGGMQNINEEHSTSPAFDFSVSLLAADYGLPAPEVISLGSVIGTNLGPTGHYDLFDSARASGGEYWQGMRVRINGLTLVDTNGWTSNVDWAARSCAVTDGEGRQFSLVHPLQDIGPAPTNRFDAVGIFMQESGSGTDGTFGYKLFVQEIEPSSPANLDIAVKTVIAWPGSLANFQLQAKGSLESTNWAPVTNLPVMMNGRASVILDGTGAQQYFRLQRVR